MKIFKVLTFGSFATKKRFLERAVPGEGARLDGTRLSLQMAENFDFEKGVISGQFIGRPPKNLPNKLFFMATVFRAMLCLG